jgi:peptidoglycan/xylan/chitin deacetylase (PgdA/CDA1 family)
MTAPVEMQSASGPGQSKPLASLSIDLDNEWAYLKTHGDPGWAGYPSYLPLAIPMIRNLLGVRGLRATAFVVGQDAARPENRDSLASLAADGHEIGNHSFHHEPWLDRYSEQQIDDELAAAEFHIQAATGRHTVGFRGPGFSLSQSVLKVLQRRGYRYDASTLPSVIGPIARAYFLATGTFDEEQRAQLARLFGGWREGLRPLDPYRWDLDGGALMEVPVTTFPGLRVPIHLTYVMYLAGMSRTLARAYFRSALLACRISGTEPSILLHPLEFLSGDDVPGLAFFPAMRLPREVKRQVLEDCLDALQDRFEVVTVLDHALRAAARSNTRSMNFATDRSPGEATT